MDNDELYEAIERLTRSIVEHRAVQEEANTVMKALIGTLQTTAAEMEELKEALLKSGG